MGKEVKKIIHIANMQGFLENFFSRHLADMSEKGYRMFVACGDNDKLKPWASRCGLAGYKTLTLDRTLSVFNDIRSFFSFCSYLRKNKIDTVISHQAKGKLIGVTAAWLMRVPNRIMWSHGVMYEAAHGWKRKILKLLDKILASMSTKIICVSKSVSKVYKSSNKLFVIGKGSCTGVDTKITFNPATINDVKISEIRSKFGLKKDDFIVGFCGRFVNDKGIHELVDGFEMLKKRHPEKSIKLLLIGDLDNYDGISNSFFDYLKNNETIVVTGRVDHENISHYFSLFDVFVLPSYREGFGMVTIEAGAMGVPAIVSKATGCIDSIVENQTGLYCDISPESICEQLEYMMLNDDERQRMGENARKWIVENFETEEMLPLVEKIIVE